jgi:hypothetical protein
MRRVARKQIVGILPSFDNSSGSCATFCRRRQRVKRTCDTGDDIESPPSATVEAMPVPANCTDGFFGACWRCPRAYLDQMVRNAISGLALLDSKIVDGAIERLRYDLASGRWMAMYAPLLRLNEIDLGYRLVVAGP